MSINRIAKNLGSCFCNKLGKLVFRRVGTVLVHEHQKIMTKFYSDDSTFYKAGVDDVFTDEEETQNVERVYKVYHGFTTVAYVRETDPIFAIRHTIGFDTKNMCELDMEELSFKLKKIGEEVPKILVKPGDLIAGFVVNRKDNPVYIKWFVCSEQFLRLWTLLMYGEEHQTFTKKLEEESTHPMGPLFKWLMSGNRLCTNNYLKWSLASVNEGVSVDERERRKRYFRYRCEESARKYIHLYACIAMICIYETDITESNIPRTLDSLPQLKAWHLPTDFRHKLIDMFDFE